MNFYFPKPSFRRWSKNSLAFPNNSQRLVSVQFHTLKENKHNYSKQKVPSLLFPAKLQVSGLSLLFRSRNHKNYNVNEKFNIRTCWERQYAK